MSSARLGLIIAWLLTISNAAAGESKKTLPVATWEKSSDGQVISIDVSSLLSGEQQEIINSGFSTFTILGLSLRKAKNPEDTPEIRLVCRVKYDTWEEKYLTTKLDPAPTQKFVGNKIESWANQCLRYKLINREFINKLTPGGQLYVSLQVRQSSIDEASKIKDWLVQQQSGFMQGLYSHMLGDLQLGGRSELVLEIPPIPSSTKPTLDNRR